MNRSSEAKSQKVSSEAINELIIDSIQDIKGKNIIQLDLRELGDGPTDFFIICEGDSNTQIKAISDRVYRRMKDEMDLLPSHLEGQQNARWICIDYFTTVVHVFHPEARSFYELEELWSDAVLTEFHSI